MNLDRLFRPKTVAVFGGREADEVVRQSKQLGFQGEIWPVHPRHAEVAGQRCYRCVDELPGAPDASFIGVNRHQTIEVVRALREAGAGGAVCYASGFSESQDGTGLQAALVEAAREMPVLGPNCYGMINYLDGALLWPDQHGGKRVARGVALFAQSSNVLLNLTMQARGLPIAYVLALGNQAQTDMSEAIRAVVSDDRVTAVGLHIEGFRDIPALEQVVRQAHHRNLPLVAIKAGGSDRGATLALSHTASLAGKDRVAGALLERLGIPRVASLESLIETLKILHVHGPLAGSDISSMSCSGGEAMLMADAADTRRVSFPKLSSGQKQRVADTVTDLVRVSNPLDYHTFNWNDEEKLYSTYRAMLGCSFDLSILILDFPRQDRCDWDTWQPAVDAIIRAARDTGEPAAVLSTLPENLPEPVAEMFIENGLVPLCGMEHALDAVEAAAMAGVAGPHIPEEPLPGPLPVSGDTVRLQDEWQGKQILASWGIPVPPGQRVQGVDQAVNAAREIGFPVVVKTCIPGLAHKSERGGVVLNLHSEDAVRTTAERLLDQCGELIVERMVTDGIAELIVGFEHDTQVGPSLLIGAGGIRAELVRDCEVVLLPAGENLFRNALERLNVTTPLTGYRGSTPGDIDAILAVLDRVSAIVLSDPGAIVELEINPLIVLPVGHGVVAVDALLCQAEKHKI